MNNEKEQNNNVFLTGKIIKEPVFSHETFGEAFYEMIMEIDRLSQAKDILPVIISEKFLKDERVKANCEVTIKGQFRSFNQIEDGKSKLILRVFVREIDYPSDDLSKNIIEISGYICKPPIYRTTPFKREICDILVAVNRAYNKSDYLPCIAWGRNARYLKNSLIGERVDIIGRIQSREYQKREGNNIITKVAYEISVARVATTSIEELEEVEG